VENEIPKEVIRFFAEHIASLEQLEVLLLVSALPDRDWTTDAVFQVVQTNRDVVQKRLDEFVARGMLAKSDAGYRYAPKTDSLARQIAAVSQLYKLRRHKLIELIYSPRDEDLRMFSDAFKFRKKD
jgi:hypothetical protein